MAERFASLSVQWCTTHSLGSKAVGVDDEDEEDEDDDDDEGAAGLTEHRWRPPLSVP